MRRIVLSFFTVVFILALVGYAAGLYTGEVRKEESCVLCRATRYSGQHYGFTYERVEDTALTEWYRKNIDPQHGEKHAHTWQQSACTVEVQPWLGATDYQCSWVAPLFLLRPEIEMAVLQKVPDKQTQASLLRSLNSTNRKVSATRIRYLIEYFYIDQYERPWADWWREHSVYFDDTLAGAR